MQAVVFALSVAFAPSIGLAIQDTRDLANVGVDERLGQRVPRGLEFIRSDGTKVRLGELFDGKRPVVLGMVYYRCPRLCSFIVDGIADAVAELRSLEIGADYRVVNVSIDPTETPNDAAAKASAVFERFAEKGVGPDDWLFLTGGQPEIDALAAAVGFRYVKDGDQFAHPAAVAVLSPDGTIARYLYGVKFSSFDFRLALAEAARGEIGKSTLANKVLLFCYYFDPVGRRYGLAAHNILKAGGVVTMLGVGSMIGYLVWGGKKEKKTKGTTSGGLKG